MGASNTGVSAWGGRWDDTKTLNDPNFDDTSMDSYTQTTGVVFRMRYRIWEDAGKDANVGALQYSTDGGTNWSPVTTTSSVIKSVPSSQFTDGDATTELFPDASSFVAGVGDEDGSASVTINNNATEIEYSLQIITADVTDGQQFRVQVVNDLDVGQVVITAQHPVPVSSSFTADSTIENAVSSSFTADAQFQTPVASSFTADAVIEYTTIESATTADAILQRTESGSADAQAYILAVNTFLVDALLKKRARGWVSHGKGKIPPAFIHELLVDAFIQHTLKVDATIQNTVPGSFSADATIQETFSATFTAGAWINQTQSGFSFSTDAYLHSTVQSSFTADANITLAGDVGFLSLFDATATWLTEPWDGYPIDIDAIIEKTQEGSLSADSTLFNVSEASVTVDAYIEVLSYAYPIEDAYVGNWTTDTGASTGLAQTIDEEVANDSDYVQSEQSAQTSAFVTKMSPTLSEVSKVVYRYRKNSSNAEQMDLTVELREGYTNEGSPGTLIASWNHTDIGSGIVEASQDLSAGEIASITDTTDLYLRFVANAPGGG